MTVLIITRYIGWQFISWIVICWINGRADKCFTVHVNERTCLVKYVVGSMVSEGYKQCRMKENGGVLINVYWKYIDQDEMKMKCKLVKSKRNFEFLFPGGWPPLNFVK